MILPNLPVVLPHQEEMGLKTRIEKEQEHLDEVEQLRKCLDDVHAIYSSYFWFLCAQHSFFSNED